MTRFLTASALLAGLAFTVAAEEPAGPNGNLHPLIDNLSFPFLRIGGVRGRFFTDIGTAWYDTDAGEFNYLGQSGFIFIEDGRLVDGFASYGFGITLRVMGLPLNWDFMRLYDLKTTLTGTESNFWIGVRW